MPFKVFVVPVRDAERAVEELNGFLRSHRVLAVDRRWVEVGGESFWAFCVDYLDARPDGGSGGRGNLPRNKIDYKEVLEPDEFAVFSRLRDWRKQVAQSEAVPVYTVFTNQQLAQMVQTRAATKAGLEQIAGVGDARVEKYGPRILELLATCWSAANEAQRGPVAPNPGP